LATDFRPILLHGVFDFAHDGSFLHFIAFHVCTLHETHFWLIAATKILIETCGKSAGMNAFQSGRFVKCILPIGVCHGTYIPRA